MKTEELRKSHPISSRSKELRQYLVTALPDRFGANISLHEFDGGASNPTFRVDSDAGSLVLRTKPVGNLAHGAHAIHREWKVLEALKDSSLPTPEPLLYCDDETIIGAEFYVMEYIPGTGFDDYSLPGLTLGQRVNIYRSLNDAISTLHMLDPDAIGLSDWGHRGSVFERQIKLWTGQYHKLETDHPGFLELGTKLANRAPQNSRRSLLHGDMTFLNMIVDTDKNAIAGILDWELSTVGDALADITYHLLPWYLPSNPKVGYNTLVGCEVSDIGIPTMDEYLEEYLTKTGFAFSRGDINFGIAFNLFRMAGIAMGAVHRAKTGTAKNDRAKHLEGNIASRLEQANEYLLKSKED